MAATSAKRLDGPLREFHDQLSRRGKPRKVAMMACVNKLARWLNAMERERIEWSQMHAATPS